MSESFEAILTGGHPNSLGRTLDVVETVLSDTKRVNELFDCYQSVDEIVRLRVSNALRRVQAEQPDLLIPFTDRLLNEIANLDQASAQWTLPKLFTGLHATMTAQQKDQAIQIVKRNLEHHSDWIVLNNSIEYLADLAEQDERLKTWLLPHLNRLTQEVRKSVKARASKALNKLQKTSG